MIDRRDFIAMTISPAVIRGAQKLCRHYDEIRRTNLIEQGRLKAVRYPLRDCLSRDKPPEFPTDVPITSYPGFTRILPSDAIQIEEPHYDTLYCGWIAIFAHESFPVVSVFEHLPMHCYAKRLT